VGEVSIPKALQSLIGGVVLSIPIAQSKGATLAGVGNSRLSAPHGAIVTPQMTIPDGTGGHFLVVTPQDLATIYNVRPIWAQGITGTGQTIVIPAASNVRADDWLKFRSSFGLPVTPLSTIHPDCADPGIDANWLLEASIDTEWAGAA